MLGVFVLIITLQNHIISHTQVIACQPACQRISREFVFIVVRRDHATQATLQYRHPFTISHTHMIACQRILRELVFFVVRSASCRIVHVYCASVWMYSVTLGCLRLVPIVWRLFLKIFRATWNAC